MIKNKIINISPKRQITIPSKFFDLLGFESKAECILRGNELIIRPQREMPNEYFSEQILADLIDKGLSGQDLLAEFKKQQIKIKDAIESVLLESKLVAEGKSCFATYDDVFKAKDSI